MGINELLFAAKNENEKALILVGRMEAFAAYVKGNSYIDRKIAAAMLGFELDEAEKKEE